MRARKLAKSSHEFESHLRAMGRHRRQASRASRRLTRSCLIRMHPEKQSPARVQSRGWSDMFGSRRGRLAHPAVFIIIGHPEECMWQLINVLIIRSARIRHLTQNCLEIHFSISYALFISTCRSNIALSCQAVKFWSGSNLLPTSVRTRSNFYCIITVTYNISITK